MDTWFLFSIIHITPIFQEMHNLIENIQITTGNLFMFDPLETLGIVTKLIKKFLALQWQFNK